VAVQIGMALKKAEVDVIVDGICLSSCANYLFTAGRQKMIRNGVVGFHGNTGAVVEEKGVIATIRDLPSEVTAAERGAYKRELIQTVRGKTLFYRAGNRPGPLQPHPTT
jgi:hypothetical protein